MNVLLCLATRRRRTARVPPGVKDGRRRSPTLMIAVIAGVGLMIQPVVASTEDGGGAGEPALEAEGEASRSQAGTDTVVRLRRLHDRLLRAVAAQRWDRAESTLARIDEELPAGQTLYARLSGWYALKRGQNERAMRAFERVLASEPGDENAALNLAFIHYRADRSDTARRVLERALDHAPGSKALSEARDRLPR